MLRAAASLEAIATSFEGYMGMGIDPQAALFADHAVRSATAPLRVEPVLIASCESFERRPIVATRLSMEATDGWLNDLWKHFKELMDRLYSMLKTFFAKLFNSNERVRQYVHKLEAKAAAAKGSPHAKYISLTEQQTRAITTDIGLIMPDHLANLRDYVWFNKLAFEMTDGPSVKARNQIAEMLSEYIAAPTKEAAEKIGEQLPKIEMPVPDIFSDKKQEDGNTVFYSPMLPGMVKFKLVLQPSTGSATSDKFLTAVVEAQQFARTRFSVIKVDQSVTPAHQYPVMTPDQVKELCGSVIKALQWIDSLKAHVEKTEQQIGGRLVGVIREHEGTLINKMLAAGIVKNLSRVEILRTQMATRTATELMNFVKNALHIAEMSLAQYGEATHALPAPAEA